MAANISRWPPKKWKPSFFIRLWCISVKMMVYKYLPKIFTRLHSMTQAYALINDKAGFYTKLEYKYFFPKNTKCNLALNYLECWNYLELLSDCLSWPLPDRLSHSSQIQCYAKCAASQFTMIIVLNIFYSWRKRLGNRDILY